jgi:uncharacterized protein with HEPN domain
MSRRKWEFRLEDMLDASRKIERYTTGLTFEDFAEDEKTIDAVIRQLIIIGEASSHIPEKITLLAPEIPWSSIRGMRNVVVHEYMSVDMRIIWKTVTRDVPNMRTQLESLQKKFIQKD